MWSATTSLWLLAALASQPQPPAPISKSDQPDEEAPPVNAVLGNLGLDVSTPDGNNRLHLWFRGQFRYSHPFDSDPTTAEGFGAPPQSSIDIRRARLKAGGNAYRSWLKYYLEFDFVNSRLLDFHFTLSPNPWLQLRLGQWKATYNRERVDSSGKQQFVERSIVNREFTVDRQPGIMLAGHLWRGKKLADSWCVFGMFNGNGARASNDDGSMMWVARYQWQFLGRDLRFSQTDVEYTERPAATLSFGAIGNKSPYTRFSGSGGGQLGNFENGAAGQYEVTQFLEEVAFKYRGFSFQHELHWKDVDDTVNHRVTDLRGTYLQAGYIPWAGSDHMLKPLELAVRYAWVDDDTSRPDDDRRELTFGANWFFSGHDNKLTVDLSRLTLDQPDGRLDDVRVRFQWDVSF